VLSPFDWTWEHDEDISVDNRISLKVSISKKKNPKLGKSIRNNEKEEDDRISTVHLLYIGKVLFRNKCFGRPMRRYIDHTKAGIGTGAGTIQEDPTP
jgi:hypothetical protein